MTTPSLTSASVTSYVNCKPAFIKLKDDNILLCEDTLKALNLFMDISGATIGRARHISSTMSSALLLDIKYTPLPWSVDSITGGESE